MEPNDLMVPVADGVRLHVRHWAGTGAPFVLVHGLSSNARLWDGVAAALAAAGHPAYAVDLRSHGESDQPPDGYDTATAAADLAAACRVLRLPPVIAVGQSWGGNVVVSLAAGQPEATRALALVDGGWIDLSTEFASWQVCERRLRPPDLDGLSERALRTGIRYEHRDWGDWAVDATVANFRVRDGRLERRLPIPYHMRILRSMWDDPPLRYYGSLTVPVLLLPAVPRDPQRATVRGEVFDRALASLPRATVKRYVNADHDLHAQHPDEVARDLLDLAARA
jgi:pimeloyl-ACP methyl ester carboxylesterase